MPVSLTNSTDIIANSVSVVQKCSTFQDWNFSRNWFGSFYIRHITEIAQSINNDNNVYHTIINSLATKANWSDVYTRTQTFSQTEINDKLSTQQASITSPTSLTWSSITTDKIISRCFNTSTGYTYLNFKLSNASLWPNKLY